MDEILQDFHISRAIVSDEKCEVKFGWILRDPNQDSLGDFSDETRTRLAGAINKILKKGILAGATSAEFYPEDYDIISVTFENRDQFREFIQDFEL